MTAIALTAAQIAMVDPMKCKTRTVIAAVALTKGQAAYINTSGKADLADANGSGTKQFRGIVLNTVGAGEAVTLLQEGDVYGFTVSAMNADAIAYLSNTAGGLDTAAGSTTVAVGRVVCLTDTPTLTKVLNIFIRPSADWS